MGEVIRTSQKEYEAVAVGIIVPDGETEYEEKHFGVNAKVKSVPKYIVPLICYVVLFSTYVGFVLFIKNDRDFTWFGIPIGNKTREHDNQVDTRLWISCRQLSASFGYIELKQLVSRRDGDKCYFRDAQQFMDYSMQVVCCELFFFNVL